MTLPKTVQIGPYTYRVAEEWHEHGPAELVSEKLCYGTTTHSSLVITLRPGLPGDKTRATLVHELLHALWELGALDEGQEEVVINTLAPLILDTLRRNKRLTEYLLG